MGEAIFLVVLFLAFFAWVGVFLFHPGGPMRDEKFWSVPPCPLCPATCSCRKGDSHRG